MNALDIQLALRCARILSTSVFQNRTPPRWLSDHIAQLEALAAGSASATKDQVGQEESEMIGTAEAAQILGCSDSYLRRIRADLDGRQITKNAWVFNRKQVEEYASQRNENRSRTG